MARCQDEQLVVLSHQLFRCYDPNPNLDGMVCSYALVCMTCVWVCVCASVHMTCVCARVYGVCGERASEREEKGRQAGTGSERAIKREGGNVKEREGESVRTLNALVSVRHSTLHVTQRPSHRRLQRSRGDKRLSLHTLTVYWTTDCGCACSSRKSVTHFRGKVALAVHAKSHTLPLVS
jgi:hypothetical protein